MQVKLNRLNRLIDLEEFLESISIKRFDFFLMINCCGSIVTVLCIKSFAKTLLGFREEVTDIKFELFQQISLKKLLTFERILISLRFFCLSIFQITLENL